MTVPGRLLLVGPAETLKRIEVLARGRHWVVTTLNEPRDVLPRLRHDPDFDLIVFAPAQCTEACVELCRAVKFDRRTAFLSVIFLIQPAYATLGEAVLAAGADDCILATASDREIVLRIQHAIAHKQATDSLEDAEALITSLAKAIEGKDEYTCGHVDRVGDYCVEIGRRVGLDAESLTALRKGGVVHDIGKIGIPDQILNKPGKLTDEELSLIHI